MTTIFDIITSENAYSEKCMNEQYAKIKAEYDLMLKAEKDVLSQKKWELYENKKKFPEIKKEYNKSNFIFPIKTILGVSVWAGLLFELIYLGTKFDDDLWTWLAWLLSIFITVMTAGLFAWLDEYFEILRLDELFNDYNSNKRYFLRIENEIKSLPHEIRSLEEKIEQLKQKYPKIEELKSYYTSKDFYTKIDIDELLKGMGKTPIMRLTTNC